MKIAFDENIPLEMVRIFREEADTTLALGHLVVSARDYRLDEEHDDVNWVGRFAKEGGNVIISGDVRMRSLAHERAALADAGLVAYFFVSEWNNAQFHMKAAMLIRWWPRIVEHAGTAAKGTCWEIPYVWNTGELRDVSARSSEIVTALRPRKARRRKKRGENAKTKVAE